MARGQYAWPPALQLGAVSGPARGRAAAGGAVHGQGLLGIGQALAQAVKCLLRADQKKFDFSVTLLDWRGVHT